eukprot:Plantae.Rhodophyta-Rhodochaete_pulchella.ctg7863.p1 GENE.Plantae.Rhodophyta-Rhodochaete_pulchella.ctg7863~~Plantae.Rhodophyta-Rhodochaete_pulchella.ctg7863.p1  ORF type:complete len:934 (+),score=124.14 Plantae.Rhodophyta-Rhodochaete_pulchella.ctg7863:1661-4462(+)
MLADEEQRENAPAEDIASSIPVPPDPAPLHPVTSRPRQDFSQRSASVVLPRRVSGVFSTTQSDFAERLQSRTRRLDRVLSSDPRVRSSTSLVLGSFSEALVSVQEDVSDSSDAPWWKGNNNSLFLFAPESSVRLACKCIVEHWIFQFLILVVVLVNCVFLALDDPSASRLWVANTEIVFLVIFTGEFAIKCISSGFALRPRSHLVLERFGEPYTRNPMNWIDLIVLLTSWPAVIAGNSALQGFLALRALRALRAMTFIPQLRPMIVGIFVSLPLLGNVICQAFSVLSIFSVVGLTFFLGTLHQNCTEEGALTGSGVLCGNFRCPDVNGTSGAALTCSRYNAEGSPFEAPNFGFTNFDNIMWSELNVFTAFTLEGWTSTMYQVMDVTTAWSSVYFVFLIVLGAFIIANLMVAVIVETFQTVHDNFSGHTSGGVSEEPQRWSRVKAKAKGIHDNLAASLSVLSPIRRPLRKLATSNTFDIAVIVIVFANAVVLAWEHDGMSSSTRNALEICNFVFSIVFVVETCLKLFAYGLWSYFSDAWNLVDFVASTIAVIEWLLPSNLPAFSVFRSLRVVRLARLLRVTKNMRLLMRKLAKSIVSVLAFLPMLCTFMFVFALMGMHLLGKSYRTTSGTTCTTRSHPATGCPRTRWASAGDSLLAVFQVLTGENWNSVMYDGMRFSSHWTSLFFIAMFVVLNYILLNIFLATIVIDFAEITNVEILEMVEERQQGLAGDLEFSIDHELPFSELAPSAAEVLGNESNPRTARGRWTPRSNQESQLPTNDGETNARADTSLFLFTSENNFRIWCQWISEHHFFEWGGVLITLCASISLALWNPRLSAVQLRALRIADLVFLALFVGEFVIRVIACGFVRSSTSYLRNGWNILDFFVILCGIVDVALWNTSVSWLRPLRALRAIRPLRLVRYFNVSIPQGLWANID